MEAQAFNQVALDQVMHAHNQCMTHALDSDPTEWLFWSGQRELLTTACKASAQAANAARAHHTATFVTVIIPKLERIKRARAVPTAYDPDDGEEFEAISLEYGYDVAELFTEQQRVEDDLEDICWQQCLDLNETDPNAKELPF